MESFSFGNFSIFASGTGTNALALIEKAKELSLVPEFVLVNKKESPLLKIVPEMGIPCFFIESKIKGVDSEFEAKAKNLCEEYDVEWLFLAGFLKILSFDFVKGFEIRDGVSRILNIHPSLLPKYPGLGGYKKAWTNGDETFGHSIHLVTPDLDSGPTLFQKSYDRKNYNSFDHFLETCKREENDSYKKVFQNLVENGLSFEHGHFYLKGTTNE